MRRGRPTAHGNLYTGPNTEDTPAIVEATAFRHGIVIAQVNEIVDELPRVDIPGSWVDVVVAGGPAVRASSRSSRAIPRQITELQVLMGMMVIRGIYERHGVTSLNHGIGFDTAAIELLLPTYGAALGLKGKICRNWALNPHPTLIPAIESGWVESVHCFGSEVGMERVHRARGRTCSSPAATAACAPTACSASWPASTRVDLFIGSTLQMDRRRQLLDRDARPPRRLRRRAQHGQRSARPPPQHARPGSSSSPATGPLRARPQARGADWSRPSEAAACRPSSSPSMRSKSASQAQHADRPDDDLRR